MPTGSSNKIQHNSNDQRTLRQAKLAARRTHRDHARLLSLDKIEALKGLPPHIQYRALMYAIKKARRNHALLTLDVLMYLSITACVLIVASLCVGSSFIYPPQHLFLGLIFFCILACMFHRLQYRRIKTHRDRYIREFLTSGT